MADLEDAWKLGPEMVVKAKERAAELGFTDDLEQRFALRQAAVDLAAASCPPGWCMFRITIDPYYPPGHPCHAPRPARRGRPRSR